MSKIDKIEDIKVWKLGMELCSSIYKITNSKEFSSDFALRDQIRKSAISIPSNIAEGFERDSNRQFVYFLTVSKGSCGELRTQLLIAHNCGYVSNETFSIINEKCLDLSKGLGAFIKYLKQTLNKKQELNNEPANIQNI